MKKNEKNTKQYTTNRFTRLECPYTKGMAKISPFILIPQVPILIVKWG